MSASSVSSASGSPRPVAGEPDGEPQAEQRLLGPVVEVALDPAALRVGRGHQPGARFAHVVQPRAQLGLQARVLQRELRGRGHRPEQLRVLEQRRVVDQRRERLVAVVAQHRDAAAVVVVERLRRARGVDVDAAVGQPVRQLQRGVAERAGEQGAQLLRTRLRAQLDHQVGDRRVVLARAQHADQDPDRDQRERPERRLVRAPVAQAEAERHEQHGEDRVLQCAPQHRVERASPRRARRAPALRQDQRRSGSTRRSPTAP